MRKVIFLVIVLSAVIFIASTSMAVPPGKTVEFKDGKMGKVVFDGKKHADAGKKCKACHPKPFQMKKGTTKFTMKDINAGKFCGACHNGEVAFKASEAKNCKKCHKR